MPASYGAASLVPGAAALSVAPGAAVRSNPRVLRVWIAPWEDSDGDLHEEAVMHVVVDSGRWLIEHVRPAARTRIDGVTAPPVTSTNADAKPTAEGPPPTDSLPLPPGIGAPRPDTLPGSR